jgi:hypothetical protein
MERFESMPTLDEKNEFLKNDLYDSLRWLFVGAVAWYAPERCPNQIVLGMYTSLVQARALYEFYYGRENGDNARSVEFARSWRPVRTSLYSKYMAARKPANKRVFHLVYNRSSHAGGQGHAGPDHINKQVLKFAKDLYRLTEEFIQSAQPNFRLIVKSALDRALDQANHAADGYGVANPI